jgi:hypothetical protein
MGRPIQKKWFGVSTGAQIIVSGVKFADGTTATSAYIVKQTGSNAYVVSNGSKSEIVYMVNATSVGSLNASECYILCTPFGGSAVPCKKIAQFRVDVFESNGSIVGYTWSTQPAVRLGQADLIPAPVVGVAPANTVAPVASPGAGLPGDEVSVTDGTWTGTAPITYTYQWTLEGEDIVGATNSTYTSVDEGEYVCNVTATNAIGSDVAASNGAYIGS